MRGLVQRVSRATVTVEGVSGEREITGEIGAGILVFVGVTHDDTEAHAAKLADKIWNLRIFDDADGVMNRSAADEGHEVLVVSQFTLYGDTRKGGVPATARRPARSRPSRWSRPWSRRCARPARSSPPAGSVPIWPSSS